MTSQHTQFVVLAHIHYTVRQRGLRMGKISKRASQGREI